MIRRPPRSTLDRSSAASDVYKRQPSRRARYGWWIRPKPCANSTAARNAPARGARVPGGVLLAPRAGTGYHRAGAVDAATWDADARWLAEHFAGRAWIAFERHLRPDDHERLARLRELAAATQLPLVAAGDVHMHARSRRPLQDVLAALRINTTVAAAGAALFPNGERHLRSRLALARLYPPELLADEINRASPRTQSALLEAMAETVRIVARCGFSFDELRYEYPDEVVPAGETPDSWLRQLTADGLLRRYIVALVNATRRHPSVQMGASPRASIALFQLARVLAQFDGETYVTPDLIQEIAPDVLAHRLALDPQARYSGVQGAEVIREILRQVPVPV